MQRAILMIAAVIALLGVPAATAQAPASDFALSATSSDAFIDPAGATNLDVEVTIGCALILQGAEQGSITISGSGPEWLSVATTEIPVGVADCAGDDDLIINKTGIVAITPDAAAPGLTTFEVVLEASFTDGASNTVTAPATVEGLAVDYVFGHTMSHEGDQTFEVTGEEYAFDLQIDITANARTMVMFENRVVSGGTLAGLAHKVFEVPTGETSTTYSLSWKAPEGDWTEETVTFYNYSHCLDKDDCPPTTESNPTWTFVNAAPHDNSDGHHDEGKDSPGLPLVGVVVVLALVLVARRR